MTQVDTKPVKESGLPVLWVVGGPGSGKTTQCAYISRIKEFIHVPVDELVKEEVNKGSERGTEISKLMSAGEPTPITHLVEIIAEFMVDRVADHFPSPDGKAKGILIDGFPTNVEQAKQFLARICPVTRIIHLDMEIDDMMERTLKKGDDMEKSEKGIVVFQQETIPMLNKYQDKVIKVDGSEMSFLVSADITSALMDAGMDPRKGAASFNAQGSIASSNKKN